MTTPQSYRNRAADVRAQARLHLLELRRARVKQRKAHPESSISEPLAGDPPLALDDELEMLKPNGLSPEVTEVEGCKSKDEVAREAPLTDPAIAREDMAFDEIDDIAIENIAMSEMHQPEVPAAPEKPTITEASGGIGPTPVSENVSDTETHANDLERLPGAGPGLTWMLNECGITNLESLAAADPVQLTKDLGLVGQILDIEQWITFAKSA